MNKLLRAIALLFLAFTLKPTTHAQQSTGTYTTYVSGNAVVTEDYTVRTEADGSTRAEAEIGAPSAAGAPRQRAVTIIRNACH